jgi:hypothetical protein
MDEKAIHSALKMHEQATHTTRVHDKLPLRRGHALITFSLPRSAGENVVFKWDTKASVNLK